MNSFSFQAEEFQSKMIKMLELLTQVIGVEPEFNQNRYIYIGDHVSHTIEGIAITHINHEHATDATGSYIFNIHAVLEDIEGVASIIDTMLVHAGDVGAIKQIVENKELTAKVSITTINYAPSNIINKAPIFKEGDSETITDIAALESILDEHNITPAATTITVNSHSKVNSLHCDAYDDILFTDEC